MTGWLWTLIGGCAIDLPNLRPPTSQEMIAELPNTPAPVPVAPAPLVPGAAPVEVTMHQVRGTPAGTNVMVSGFLVAAGGSEVNVSADSEGKTLQLRCQGGGTAVLGETPQTPVRVTGTVGAPDGHTMVLTACTAEVAGEAPR